jgi:2,3-diaminopropionate biosynthesis protein SbnA
MISRLPITAPPSDLGQRMSTLVGAMRETPIVPLDQPGMALYAKLEYCTLIGSLKDRPALWILQRALERGDLDGESVIVESSSGNFAIALAAICRMLGVRFIPVIDPNISPLNEATLRASCETVIKVDKPDESGGSLKTRLSTVHELRNRIPGAFWPNQYGNIDGMDGHYYLTAGDICRSFTKLDFVFIGVSSGGTISGVSRRLKEHFPDVKIIAVDSEGSVIFGGKPKKRHIPGIGASIVPQLLQHAIIDDTVIVPERETVAACRELLVRHRIFAGGSSGSAYAAIKRYMAANPTLTRPNVLFLCADRGVSYMDTVYDDTWVKRFEEV